MFDPRRRVRFFLRDRWRKESRPGLGPLGMAEGLIERDEACEYWWRFGHRNPNRTESFVERRRKLGAGGGQGLGLLPMPGGLLRVSEPFGDLGQTIVALGVAGIELQGLLKGVRRLFPLLAVNTRQATVFPTLTISIGVLRQLRHGGSEAIEVVLSH